MVHFKQKSTGQKFKMASLSVKRSIRALLAILPIRVVLDLHQLIFLDLYPGRYFLFLFPVLRENRIIRYQFYYS